MSELTRRHLLDLVLQQAEESHPVQHLLEGLVDELEMDLGMYVRFNPDSRALVLQETYVSRELPNVVETMRDMLEKASISGFPSQQPNPELGFVPLLAWKQLASSEAQCTMLQAKKRGRVYSAQTYPQQSLAIASGTTLASEIYIPVIVDTQDATTLHGVLVLVGCRDNRDLDLHEVEWIAALARRSMSWALSNWQRSLWNTTLKRMGSLLWPGSFDQVYRWIIDSIGIMNRLEPHFPVIKLVSAWSFGRDVGSGILAKQAMHNFLVDGYSPEASRVLVGSVIGDPPSPHLLFQEISRWTQEVLRAYDQSSGLDFADFVRILRVSDAESGFYDYSRFLAANHLEPRDLLALVPILNTSLLDPAADRRVEPEALLKGMLVIYVDKDGPSDLLQIGFLAELANSVFTLLERAKLTKIRLIRKAVTDLGTALFRESDGRAEFLSLTAQAIRDHFGVEGCSIYLYDPSTASLVLSGSTGLFEIKSGKAATAPLPEDLYINCRYNTRRRGKSTWRFFAPHLESEVAEGSETLSIQDSCIRTADNYYGCRSAAGSCSKYSETSGLCYSKLQTVIVDSNGRGIGLVRCVNKKQAPELLPGEHRYSVLSPEEMEALQECAQMLGLLLELREKSESAERLLKRVGHELPTQIGLIMQNMEEIESVVLRKARRSETFARESQSHLRNLFDETGYSALIIQYFTSISTLLSLTKEQVSESKRPLRLRTFLAKSLQRLRNQARERGVYIQYSTELEEQDPVILADRSFDLALINIMNNAIQYCGFGTCPLIDWKERRDGFDLTITDLGIPLPKGIPVQTIYEDGYRAPEARAVYNRGTGFGLTVAKHVVDKHGFQISTKCPANPISDRNIFGVQAVIRSIEDGSLSDIAANLGVPTGDRPDLPLLELQAEDVEQIDKNLSLALPQVRDASIHLIPRHFLRSKVDGGEDLEIIWNRYLARPLYKVTFSIRIPRSEVER